MNPTVSIIMTIALLFYTVGVWAEKIKGRLKIWHLALFVCGLIFDTLGTGIMFRISEGISFSVHGIAGLVAISLMFIHAVWAFYTLLKKEEKRIVNFHRFSFFVWAVWLIPYLSPMFMKCIDANLKI